MNQVSKLLVFFGLIVASIGCGAETPNSDNDQGSQMPGSVSEAKYEITFISLWDDVAHLGRPGSAHFSPLVISAHTDEYVLLPIGGLTNRALEDVAELGRTRLIERELSGAVNSGSVDSFIVTQNQFVPGTPSQSETLVVNKNAALFSLVTMIAPSPDWVVGVDSLNLLDSNGEFIEDTGDIMLFAYDAGTEGPDFGGNFTINGTATVNPTPIERLRGPGFETPFAMLRLKKIN